ARTDPADNPDSSLQRRRRRTRCTRVLARGHARWQISACDACGQRCFRRCPGSVTGVPGPAPVDLAAIQRLAAEVDTTALCDVADDARVVSSALRCRSANPVLCGPAITVRCRDDFLGVIQAIEQAGPGDVVVVDGGARETALA